MPARLSPKNLVARPDRVDFRDRAYTPPLRSLPPQWPPRHLIERNMVDYASNILDQGNEGACTGFGLAAVVNFIYWSAWRERTLAIKPDDKQAVAKADPRPPLVSPHMLYHNAKLYDEWEGADYEGSSCRGAMKGWHKHGICTRELWNPKLTVQKEDWRNDAAARPLGAYYRVDAKSIADMQAAIYEVRSVYCAADVHDGWSEPNEKTEVDGVTLARIKFHEKATGGHAFAIVGYTSEGFIVQNSWGKDWGTGGFALFTYEDWIKNGYDAWVAAIGAPMQATSPSAAGRTNLMNAVTTSAKTYRAGSAQGAAAPWSEQKAYHHAIILGNDGKLVQRIVGAKDPIAALNVVVQTEVEAQGHKHVALYVHGGLNDEQSGINRARRMGPWFTANGIHPIFLIWRTGFMESLGSIAADEIKKFEEQVKAIRARGLGDAIEAAINALAEAKDRAFEAAAEKLIGKAVWSQIKQNAAMAASGSAPLTHIARALATHKGINIHVLGHSAGAIMLGHFLDVAGRASSPLSVASCGLYAPACTLSFAADKYGKAMAKDGPLAKARLAIDVMSDSAETDDTVGPYGKSLLYLVSRALEDVHKMPLLGLDLAVNPDSPRKNAGMKLAETQRANAYKQWQSRVAATKRLDIGVHNGPKIKTSSTQREDIAHGTFDNDIDIVNKSLERMLGQAPKVKITDLTGF